MKITMNRRMAGCLGIVFAAMTAASEIRAQIDEEVIFQDDLVRQDSTVGIPMEESSPTVGEIYTGQGTLFNKGNATGEEEEILKAFNDRPFVRPENAGFQSLTWNISNRFYELMQGKVVTISFDFYVGNRGGDGKGAIGIISFLNEGVSGRGWDLALKDNGTVSWWDGKEFHEADVTFDTDKVVPFKLVVDFDKRSYVATIGEHSFTGKLTEEVRGFRRLMLYNSTGVAFYYTDPKITCVP